MVWCSTPPRPRRGEPRAAALSAVLRRKLMVELRPTLKLGWMLVLALEVMTLVLLVSTKTKPLALLPLLPPSRHQHRRGEVSHPRHAHGRQRARSSLPAPAERQHPSRSPARHTGRFPLVRFHQTGRCQHCLLKLRQQSWSSCCRRIGRCGQLLTMRQTRNSWC